MPIEDYALIGDTHTAALVGGDGSIDGLCAPRFDSAACFATLVGEERHGRWLLTPTGAVRRTRRRYREGSLVLETDFKTEEGSVRVVDFMPVGAEHPHVVRIVEGLDGSVAMRMELIVRFEYGSVIPWVHRSGDAVVAVGGPDALCLRSDIETHGQDFTTVSEFRVQRGQRLPFVLSWFPSHRPLPKSVDAIHALTETEEWSSWHARSGSPTASTCWVASTTPAPCSNGSSVSGTRSASSPRNTTSAREG